MLGLPDLSDYSAFHLLNQVLERRAHTNRGKGYSPPLENVRSTVIQLNGPKLQDIIVQSNSG